MVKRLYCNNKSSVWAALIGAAFYLWIYGFSLLDPQNADWLLSGGDLSQHYLGWMAYRQGSWMFPFGLTDRVLYPFPSSVIFTDSIPLFAVFFKLLSPVLPHTFQYFGLWGLLCFMLHGALSAKLLRRYLPHDCQAVAGSLFFILSFQVLFRMYVHTSLAGHWLLLLALLLPVYRNGWFAPFRRRLIICAVIGVLAVSVHMYFLLMCGILLGGFALVDALEHRRLLQPALCLAAYVTAAGGMIYLLGGFAATAAQSGGLGEYSMNLNSFWNPLEFSMFFPALPATAQQREGFCYLGAGVWLALVLSCAHITAYKWKHRRTALFHRCTLVGLGAACATAVFLAVSPIVTWGGTVLWHWPVPDFILRLWGTFRASGRLGWVAVYCLFLAGLCADARILTPRRKGLILAVCLAIQLADVSGYALALHQKYAQPITYESPLKAQIWQRVAENEAIEHMVLFSPMEWDEQYPLNVWALENEWSSNQFHMAHGAGADNAAQYLEQALAHPSDDTVYIWRSGSTLDCPVDGLSYYYSDGFIVGLTQPLEDIRPLAANDSELRRYDFVFNGQAVSNGVDENGVRRLEPGGISFGPYITAPAGRYQATITGEGLSSPQYSITAQLGQMQIPATLSLQSEDRVVLEFTLDGTLDNLELLVNNSTGTDAVVLHSITIQRVPD